jgi:hypothetical protein
LGGWGSGRQNGRPIADYSSRVDLGWMIRTGRAKPGQHISGTRTWTRGGEPAGSVSYDANMSDLDDAWLELTYWHGSGDARERVVQRVRLAYTLPHYGGRRWWMICPYAHVRCGKLYLPGNGDRFASRKAWRVGYRSQRIALHDRAFEKLFRLQKKLDGSQGWDMGLARRPKGMWHRTYERFWAEYDRLDEQCSVEMALMMRRLGVF